MPRDRTGDEVDPDDLFSGPHPAGCDHGMIEEHYDAAGELLGHDRWDPAYADRVTRSVALPCPRCRPDAHARWQARRLAGCHLRDHDASACQLCSTPEVSRGRR